MAISEQEWKDWGEGKMKTPEEIKKGLECALPRSCNGNKCSTCPNATYSISELLEGELIKDVIAYIQWLESHVEQMENVIRLLGKEKDAAIHDCAMFPCSTCSDRENGDLCYTCLVHPSSERSNYNWRGVCEENTKDDADA